MHKLCSCGRQDILRPKHFRKWIPLGVRFPSVLHMIEHLLHQPRVSRVIVAGCDECHHTIHPGTDARRRPHFPRRYPASLCHPVCLRTACGHQLPGRFVGGGSKPIEQACFGGNRRSRTDREEVLQRWEHFLQKRDLRLDERRR